MQLSTDFRVSKFAKVPRGCSIERVAKGPAALAPFELLTVSSSRNPKNSPLTQPQSISSDLMSSGAKSDSESSRKGSDAESQGCEFMEIVQFMCNFAREPERLNKSSKAVAQVECVPYPRIFRMCVERRCPVGLNYIR